MLIYVRRSDGKGFKMEVDQKWEVKKLIEEACKVLWRLPGSSEKQFELYHHGIQMSSESEAEIWELGVSTHSIIHAVQQNQPQSDQQPLSVRFILDRKLFQYLIPNQTNVRGLKEQISSDLQIDLEGLTFCYLGKEMPDESLLSHFCFNDNVLLSAFSLESPRSSHHQLSHHLLNESVSEPNESHQLATRKEGKLKRPESLNMHLDQSENLQQLKYSAQLNRIEEDTQNQVYSEMISSKSSMQKCCGLVSCNCEKCDENKKANWRQSSQHNVLMLGLQSFSGSPNALSQGIQIEQADPLEKPKALQEISWYEKQKIIETESLVDEDEDEEFSDGCEVVLEAVNSRRQFLFVCSQINTLQQLRHKLAHLLGLTSIEVIFKVQKQGTSELNEKSSQQTNSSKIIELEDGRNEYYKGNIKEMGKARASQVKILYEVRPLV